ncbi:MAG: hypothetical protein ABDH31_00060 [Chlorobiota bacterium]
MKAVAALILAASLGGCGLAVSLLLDALPTPEGFRVEQKGGLLPVDVAVWGAEPRWWYAEDGGLQVAPGCGIGVRVPGLTMFRATLHVSSTRGYRLLLRSTPTEQKRGRTAPVALTVDSMGTCTLRAPTIQDTMELPAGRHRWELVQLERGYWIRFECLPQRWIPVEGALTEWVLIEPLPGSTVWLHGLALQEVIPLLGVKE